jgi:FHS family L-fucose permease-like MFS transporter
MAIVGGALIPWFSGRLADATSIGMTFVLPAIAYVGILIFAAAGKQSRLSGEGEAAPAMVH